MKDINTTIVAFHGDNKPVQLLDFLSLLTEKLNRLQGSVFSENFVPYNIYQIHATIIGMETMLLGDQLYGHWFFKNKQGEKREIDPEKFRLVLQDFFIKSPAFTIRFGGYKKAFCTCNEDAFRTWECLTGQSEFHSCGRSLYEGSFYAFSPGPAVCSGWPLDSEKNVHRFSHSLYSFRAQAEKAGFLDKYHSDIHPYFKDDDFYIKVGEFTEAISNLYEITESMREFLQKIKPVFIEIKPEDVYIILYTDTSLSEQSIIEKIPVLEAIYDREILPALFRKVKKLRQEQSGCISD